MSPRCRPRTRCTNGRGSAAVTTPSRCSTSSRAGRSTASDPRWTGDDVRVLVVDPNLVPHRERLEAAMPPGTEVLWHVAGVPEDELRKAEVFVGSRFTAEMARLAENLRLLHPAAAGTDKIDLSALSADVL